MHAALLQVVYIFGILERVCHILFDDVCGPVMKTRLLARRQPAQKQLQHNLLTIDKPTTYELISVVRSSRK